MGNNQQQQKDDIFNKIIESNKWLSENSKYCKINKEEIDNFINSLSKEQYNKHSSLVTFPLNFSSIQQEVCFWFILDLINIGSGFRKELHEVSDRGAYETICYGLLGMFLSQSGKLDSNFLMNLSVHEVSSFFNIPVSTEVQQPDMPGIYTYRDSIVKPLVVNIHRILRESAEIIYRLGHQDFGAYILSLYKIQGEGEGPLASTVVSALVDTFPALRDEAEYTNEKGEKRTIYLYKKAQLLAADLYRRFKDSDARFNFTDVDRMTIFTDNVVPAVLRKLNILQVTDDSLVQHIAECKELAAQSPQEVELRGLAIYASRLIVERAQELKPTPEENFIGNDVKLDYYLWTVGKQPEYRSFERHYTKQTLFY